MNPDPFAQFEAWWREAGRPDRMVLATATRDGRPSARYVLLKSAGRDGFTFFSGYESRKGRELAENPRAALLLYFDDRQVRVEGAVERLPPEDSDAYWATRPPGSRRSAAASRQSEPVAGRAELEAAVAAAGDDPPRPDRWGGYRLLPDAFEFWQHRDDRLHDRFLYRFETGGWGMQRLQP